MHNARAFVQWTLYYNTEHQILWHATRLPAPRDLNPGVEVRQISALSGQRGKNEQPGVFAAARVTSPFAAPLIRFVRGFGFGTASSSIRLYGCSGFLKDSESESSTIFPKYITATLSHIFLTTARLCDMKR